MKLKIKLALSALGLCCLTGAMLAQAEKIGIGVLDPQAVLHVVGDARGAGDVIFQNLNEHSGSTDQASMLVVDASDSYRVKTMPLTTVKESSDWFVSGSLDKSENVSQDIWTSGKVGIGTLRPAVELDVEGDIAATGNIYAGGQFVSSTYAQASDRRLKNNVKPYTKGLETLRALETVSFNYNGQGLPVDQNRAHYGVIAQQLQSVDPDLVNGFIPAGGDEEFLSVSTTSVIYMLANAVQQLDAEIQAKQDREDELMLENVSLRLQLLDLYARVEALETAGR